MKCPHCQNELPENDVNAKCPACGQDLFPGLVYNPEKTPRETSSDRRIWLAVFWISFFATPVALLLLGRWISGLLFPMLVFGALISGFALAKRSTKTPAALVLTTILFGVGVIVVYFGIIFVGCLVALNSR